MLVGPRHDEAVGADLAERRAQGFDPLRPLGVARIVEGLEVTGFTGSAGLAVILADEAALFVDGRYTLQAPEQVDS
jgi:Xaa-Pro aminopeptidase